MPATSEQIADDIYIIRGGPKHHVYGDPYHWACVIVGTMIKGLCGKINLSSGRDIKLIAGTLGIKEIHWERIKNGKIENFKRNIEED